LIHLKRKGEERRGEERRGDKTWVPLQHRKKSSF